MGLSQRTTLPQRIDQPTLNKRSEDVIRSTFHDLQLALSVLGLFQIEIARDSIIRHAEAPRDLEHSIGDSQSLNRQKKSPRTLVQPRPTLDLAAILCGLPFPEGFLIGLIARATKTSFLRPIQPAHEKGGEGYFPASSADCRIPPREVRPAAPAHTLGVGGPESGPAAQIVELWASLGEAEQAELLAMLNRLYAKR